MEAWCEIQGEVTLIISLVPEELKCVHRLRCDGDVDASAYFCDTT